MRFKSVGRLAAVASAVLLLLGGAATSAQAAAPGPVAYSIDFSNPQEQDDNNLPEPYGRVWVQAPWGQQTALWEHPDVDINTPTLPRYPDDGPYSVRYADHPVTELCALVGEDDTGINDDDTLAAGCVPVEGPGTYTIPGPDGSVTITLYDV
ncbi:hypothetical protein [Streptomyces caeruleatus]|uniref:Secreted protein n=1 Tax=Streptomyces caeruleatus TaxID=661399 RepID=A0A101TWU8_9ACTN|nr:hypothetical protein [Streptomyces caeruleatus]KUO00008.1 hypothetical protein AQJ67_24365 [Streptomyces caeruleatus]